MKNNLYYLLIPGMFLCLILIVSFYPNKQYVPPLEPTKPVDTKGVDLPICQYGEEFVRYDSVKYLDIIIENNRMRIKEAYPPYNVKKLGAIMNNISEVNIFADTNCNMRFRKLLHDSFRPYSDSKINYMVLDENGNLNKLEETVIGHGVCAGHYSLKSSIVFEIFVNSEEEILVERKRTEKNNIAELLSNFYKYGDGENFWTTLQSIGNLEKGITRFNKELLYYDANPRFIDSLKDWSRRLDVVNLIGEYYKIPDKAVIEFRVSNTTPYKLFIEIVEEFEKSRRELINDLIRNRFKMSRKLFELFYFEDDLKLIEKVYPRIFKSDRYMQPKPRKITPA